MHLTSGRAAIVAATTLTITLATGAGTVLAHIDPTPPAVEAGAAATVGFGVEHGCDGSPTTQVAIKLPDGVTDAAAVDKAGWTSSVADGVVTFSDGELGPETPDSFSITFTAPAQPGELVFPIVQTCVEGELAWIETAAAGAAEPEHPAPVVQVTDGPPTADTGAAATATTEHGDDDHHDGDASDDSNTATVVGVVVGVAVVGAGAAAVLLRRRRTRRA